MDAERLKEYRDYAWNYFAVHANQRMAVFQFYITLSTAVLGGAVLLAGGGDDRKWAAIIFMLLPFLSFVFWRLDQRTSELVKNAEHALKHIDKVVLGECAISSAALALFDKDENMRPASTVLPFFGHFSYSRCFRYVFVSVAFIGIAGAVAAISTKGKENSIGFTQVIKIVEEKSSSAENKASQVTRQRGKNSVTVDSPGSAKNDKGVSDGKSH